MKKQKLLSGVLLLVALIMVSIGVLLSGDDRSMDIDNFSYKEFNINNLALSAQSVINSVSDTSISDDKLSSVEMEVAPVSVYVPERIEVYDGLTIEELAAKIDRNLANDYMAGSGMLIATQCIEKGVDPYLALAIIMHETGCGSRCSNLARYCNNVSGQKGSPGCNGGSYKQFNTLEDGIIGFIDNLSNNYYARGLNTVEAIGSKYAEGNTWPSKINSMIERIRNS